MAALRSLLCLFVLLVSVSCSGETLTPFIAWSNGKNLSPLTSKQPATLEDFVKGVTLDDIKMFIVFKANQLSFNDIAKFGGVYGEKHSALSSLQSNLQSAQSTLWTGMHGQLGSGLVSTLSFDYNIDPQHVIGADDVSFDFDGKQLVEVLLPEGENDERLFLEQDKIISQFMTAITKSGKPYVAFYTADHSSPAMKPHLEVFESKREVVYDEKTGNNTAPMVTSCAKVVQQNSSSSVPGCVMMCLTTPIYLMTHKMFNGSQVPSYERADNLTFVGGSCLRSNSSKCDSTAAPFLSVVATFNESGDTLMKFIFKQGDKNKPPNNETCAPVGFWTMELEVDGNTYTRHYKSQLFSKFEVPIGASYACGSNSHNVFGSSTDNSTTFRLGRIQAQIGGKFSDANFASAYNCESYFSHVSLMGVVSILILLVFLYCSTVFMFQMKSPDRFDDPRGPTISVENLH